MGYDSFDDLLIMYGHEEIIELINNLAGQSIKISNNNTLKDCIAGLDNYYNKINMNKSFPFLLIKNNFGANELLRSTIELRLLKEEFMNNHLTIEMIDDYNILYDKITEYKQYLIEHEKELLNKKTR